MCMYARVYCCSVVTVISKRRLHLSTLSTRRVRCDLIYAYRILHNYLPQLNHLLYLNTENRFKG